MSDLNSPTHPTQQRTQQTLGFLLRTRDRLELLRGRLAAIASGDAGTWEQLQHFADHTLGATSEYELPVLRECLSELVGILAEHDKRGPVGSDYLFHLTSALDLILIELKTLVVAFTDQAQTFALD